MSARAAWRLETLGFEHVYRYTAGKVDWTGAGLPVAGELAGAPRIVDATRRDVPTCRLDERLADVRQRTLGTGWDRCLVVNEQRVVLGILRGEALDAPPETRIEDVMDPAPVTFRPDTLLRKFVKYLLEHVGEVEHVVVTTGDGELVGSVARADAERLYYAAPASSVTRGPTPE